MNDSFALETSKGSATESLSRKTEIDYVKIWVLSAIILLTIFGNGMVIAGISGRRLVGKRFYYFMLHLSTADILTGFLTLLPEVIWSTTAPAFYGGNILCKVVKTLQMLGPYSRKNVICHPLRNPMWITTKSKCMIAFAWIFSFFLCLPQSIIFSEETANTCSARFEPVWGLKAYVTWFSVSNFFVPLVFLIICNIKICKEIWRNFSRNRQIPLPQFRSSIYSTSRRKNEMVIGYWRLTVFTLIGALMMLCLCFSLLDIFHTFQQEDKFSESRRLKSQSVNEENCLINCEKKSQRSADKKQMIRCSCSYTTPEDSSGLTRAQIRSIKQTVVVIAVYVLSSSPFVIVQMWTTWGNPSTNLIASVKWLYWLLTLNSVVNPWVYMAFNKELTLPIRKILFKQNSNSATL